MLGLENVTACCQKWMKAFRYWLTCRNVQRAISYTWHYIKALRLSSWTTCIIIYYAPPCVISDKLWLSNLQDKTFGLKNKKGAKQQKFIKTVTHQVKQGGPQNARTVCPLPHVFAFDWHCKEDKLIGPYLWFWVTCVLWQVGATELDKGKKKDDKKKELSELNELFRPVVTAQKVAKGKQYAMSSPDSPNCWFLCNIWFWSCSSADIANIYWKSSTCKSKSLSRYTALL